MLGIVQKTRRAIASAMIWLLIVNNVPMLQLLVNAEENFATDEGFYFIDTVSGNTVSGGNVKDTIDYDPECTYIAKELHRSMASVSGNASLVYSSSNSDVAEVINSARGEYRINKAGKVMIIATQGSFTVSTGDQWVNYGETHSSYELIINPWAQESFGFSESLYEAFYPEEGKYAIPEPVGGSGDGAITYELVGETHGASIENNVIDFSECTLPCEVTVQAKKAKTDIYQEAIAETTVRIVMAEQEEDAFSFIKGNTKINEDEITFVPNQENTYEFIAKSTQSEAEVSYRITSQSVPDMVVYNPGNEATKEAQQLIINKPGKVVIEATQKDGPNFWGKTAKLTLVVNKAEQEKLILTTPMKSIVYNDAYGKEIPLVVTGGSGSGALSYQIVSQQLDGQNKEIAVLQDNELVINKAGVVTLQATKAGDDYYNAATSEKITFSIERAEQSIQFETEPPTNFIYGTADTYSNKATGVENTSAWDGLGYEKDAIIDYKVLAGENIAEVSNQGVLTFKDGGLGTIEVGASIAAGDRYNSASQKYQMIVIYAEEPDKFYLLKDGKGNILNQADWFNHDVYVYAPDGYKISTTNALGKENWQDYLIYDGAVSGSVTFHLREVDEAGKLGGITKELSTGTIKIDRTAPDGLKIEYRGDEKSSDSSNTDYYSAPIEVIITAKEDASEMKEFTYYLEGSRTTVTADNLKFDENTSTYSYTFTIAPQYKGKISFDATNKAGITASCTDNKTIILDSISPKLEMEFSDWLLATTAGDLTELKNYQEKNGAAVNLYYNTGMTVTFKIKEDNFDPSDVVFRDSYKEASESLDWEPGSGEDAGKWIAEYIICNDETGTHRLSLKYQDRAQNEPIDYLSEYIIIDKTPPKIDVDFENADGTDGGREEAGMVYYNSDQKVIICIKEENFRAADVKLDVLVTKASGEEDVAKLQAYLNNPRNWSKVGDENTATLLLDTEGTYELFVTYQDLANWTGTSEEEHFVMDKTLPKILQLGYQEAYNNTLACTGCVDSKDKGIDIANADGESRFVYDKQMTYRFAIRELNFNPNKVKVQLTKTDGTVVSDSDYSVTYLEERSLNQHVFEVKLGVDTNLPEDGDYLVIMDYTDMAGNPMETQVSNVITLDRTAPVVQISYAEGNADGVIYYKNNRTAIITITDRNVAPEHIRTEVVTKDIEGKEITFDLKGKQSAWKQGSAPNTWESTILCDVDAHYEIRVFCTDITERNGEAEDTFILDKTAPSTSSFRFAYSKPLMEATYGNVDYKYYNSSVAVTVTAEDIISPIASFECTYVMQNGASSINVPGKTVTLSVPSDRITYSNEERTATATFELSGAQYRGSISFRVTDMAGNTSAMLTDTNTAVVVDSILPNRSITYSPAKHVVSRGTYHTVEGYDYTSENAGLILYYDEPMTVTLQVEEANFYQTDVSVKVNGSEWAVQNWTQNGDVWTGSLTLATDGDYTVTMDYRDRSQNQMRSCVSEQITIDTTAPQLQVSYGPGNIRLQAFGIRYYDTQQTATITIAERNFRASDVKAVVTAKDVNGNDISVTDYATYLRNSDSWVKDGDKYIATIEYSKDANYTFDIGYTDLALHTAADYVQDVFTVDKTAPTNVTLQYDAPINEMMSETGTYGYYNSPITVTITAEDDVSGVFGFDYHYNKAAGESDVNVADIEGMIEEKDITFSNGRKTATATFVIPAEVVNETNQINGNLEFAAYNRSLLREDKREAKRLIIDTIAPTAKVEYSRCVKEAEGTRYYDGDINATITIVEANFHPEAVEVSISKDGGAWTPIEASWEDATVDKHIGSFTLQEEGDYLVKVTYVDASENKMTEYQSEQLTIDTTAPTLRLSGIRNYSANNQEKIGLVVTAEDVNLDVESFLQSLTAEVRQQDGTIRQLDMTQLGKVKVLQEGKNCTYIVENIERDGIYCFSCEVSDLAGNKKDAMLLENAAETLINTLNFSVNRNGSAYGLSEETRQLNNSFVQSPEDVTIYEVNPNEITNIKITLFKNDKTIVLEEGKHYSISRSGEEGEWYRYSYTIFADSFVEDGVYRISIYSEDKAGNVAENTLDVKDMEISFAIDKTAPNLVVTNLESGATYPLDKLSVMMQATDNMKLANIKVELDGAELATWDEEQIQQMSNRFEDYVFDIPGTETTAHTLTITLTDKAGNQLVEEIIDFYVTTNLWVRYYNNKLLFYGSIIAGILSIFLLLFFWKRRKDRKEEQRG